jgi:hypothetical protein
MASAGNSSSAVFSSCRQATSGFAVESQWSSTGRRALMRFTWRVAIFIGGF